VWNKIKVAFGRLWRPRRRSPEHGFYDQPAGSRYRSQQDIEAARGLSYQPPDGPTPIETGTTFALRPGSYYWGGG
jgi:hypothetical protein